MQSRVAMGSEVMKNVPAFAFMSPLSLDSIEWSDAVGISPEARL